MLLLCSMSLHHPCFSLLAQRLTMIAITIGINRWVIFLSGLAHITLPESDDEAWIHGGKEGAILALDTAAVSAQGHYTEYPSDEVTVALQVPFKEVPGHRVLHRGACEGREVDVEL